MSEQEKINNIKIENNSNLSNDKKVNNNISNIAIKNNGLDESRVVNKDYLHSLDDVYKCNICFKIMDNPTDCENCGHSFCYECIDKLKCPFGCINKSLKPSSMAIKNILSNIKFKCLNEGCKEIILYSDVKRHDNICEYQNIICPNNGCNKRLLKKDLEEHVKKECEYNLIKCQYCDYKFDKNNIKNHESTCSLVNKSLKNDGDSNALDMSKIDTNEYLKLLSMNVSKIVKDNQELLNNNNNNNSNHNSNNNINNNININNEIEQNNLKTEKDNINNSNNNEQRKEFSQVSLRPSNFAQIDEDELLTLITNGVEEELKKYFLDFDRNFIKLSKDIQDIKEYFNKNNQNNISDLNNTNRRGNKFNMLIIDENEEESNLNNNRLKNENIIERNYSDKDNNIFKKNLNLINTIKEAKESDEEDNESSKTFIKNIIEKTENGLKESISELNNKIIEQLNIFNNKLEENKKNNNNTNLTNQQKLIIENINNSIDRIIDSLNETNITINDLSNEFHNKTKEIIENKNQNQNQSNNNINNSLIEDLNNKIISSVEKCNKENYDNIKKFIDEKIYETGKKTEKNEIVESAGNKNESLNKEINSMNKEIENIQTQLSSIKNNVKQVINILTEEFADLTDLINKNQTENKKEIKEDLKEQKIDSNNISNNDNNINIINSLYKKEFNNYHSLNIDSLHKFSFGGDNKQQVQDATKMNKIINISAPHSKSAKLPNSNFIQNPDKNKKINQSNLGISNNTGSNKELLPKNSNSFQSAENNDINNDKICNSLNNLETRMTNLENFTKNIQTEIKEDISNEFKKQVINFNAKIENNLDNKINKMFSLKYCKECEKVDYFYGFIKCTLCNSENCKQCILLCLSCKHLLCRNCCSCPKCNKSYCSKCRILCIECNKKYCNNCLTYCSSCNKQICLYCAKTCSNCKINNCDINCSKTCYICSKNVCNKCLKNSNIMCCPICKNNICSDCSVICEFCKKNTCKNCLKECFKCKEKACSLCYKECAQCKEKYCNKCCNTFEKKECDLCQKIFCEKCLKNISTCYLCSKNLCKNCSSKCLCGNNYCNLCSLECEKCSRRCCNKCSSKCICQVAIFCNECLKQNNEAVLLHDCLYFSNNSAVFDKKRIRSKMPLDINDNIEAKFYLTNFNRCSKLLIGVTDNGNFEENCVEEVKNIYGVDLISGKKIGGENEGEKFMEIDLKKEDNICVYIMVKDKKLLFKINDGEYKMAYELVKEEYWFYVLKNMNESNTNNNIIQSNSNINNTNSDLISEEYSSKIKFIYVRKI